VAAALLIHASVLLLVRHARLDVTVTAEAVEIRFAPFHRRTRRIPVTDITDARRRHDRPLAEYGGWGIRLGLSGTAYNVSGSEGVQLVLTSGRRILIGSQRSGELEAAIRRARGG
jgi:hypothetical protein